MKVQRTTLDSILLNNVCDVRFARKIVRPGDAPTRRMLCTNGRISLNYFPPKNPPHSYLAPDNLVVAWDILMQDYRNISMNQCDLISQIPANEDFWTYFNESIYPMSSQQKFNFMNS